MQPSDGFGDRNIRRTYRKRYRYTFNGWAVKRTPNATKLGRRPTYAIIRPHANLHPIPRTFLCHLLTNISEVPRARASVSGLRTDNGESREDLNGYKF